MENSETITGGHVPVLIRQIKCVLTDILIKNAYQIVTTASDQTQPLKALNIEGLRLLKEGQVSKAIQVFEEAKMKFSQTDLTYSLRGNPCGNLEHLIIHNLTIAKLIKYINSFPGFQANKLKDENKLTALLEQFSLTLPQQPPTNTCNSIPFSSIFGWLLKDNKPPSGRFYDKSELAILSTIHLFMGSMEPLQHLTDEICYRPANYRLLFIRALVKTLILGDLNCARTDFEKVIRYEWSTETLEKVRKICMKVLNIGLPVFKQRIDGAQDKAVTCINRRFQRSRTPPSRPLASID